MSKYIINEQNYDDAIKALKDILYMFVDIIVQNGDFAELELGSFDPFLYIDAEIESDYVLLTDGEFNLLQQGAAIALLAKVADVYFDDECQCNDVMPFFNKNGKLPEGFDNYYPQLPKIKNAFQQNRIIQEPKIIDAFNAAFSNWAVFQKRLKVLMEYNVKNCFIELGKYES